MRHRRRALGLVVAALFATSATVRAQGDGGAALIEAAARGDLAAVRRALDAGAPVNATANARGGSGRGRGRNAVLAATQGGHVEVARLLIERGADVNAQDEIDDSAFLLAGARGHTGIVRAALPRADPTRLNRYGGTALIPACHYGHVDTVRVLLEWRGPNRIDVNHVNRLGWTALLEAVILGDGGAAHTEIVRLLLAHGADPNRADREGVTPLAHAERRGQRAVAALLRGAGAR
jgi:ankyrin repeat protein